MLFCTTVILNAIKLILKTFHHFNSHFDVPCSHESQSPLTNNCNLHVFVILMMAQCAAKQGQYELKAKKLIQHLSMGPLPETRAQTNISSTRYQRGQYSMVYIMGYLVCTALAPFRRLNVADTVFIPLTFLPFMMANIGVIVHVLGSHIMMSTDC